MEVPQSAVVSILTKIQQAISHSEAGKNSVKSVAVVLSGHVYNGMLKHYMK